MTTLANMEAGNMRGSSYRWLWEIKYEFQRPIGRCTPGGEVETVGYQAAESEFHVIAGTEELAMAAWRSQKGHGYRSLSCRAMLRVDAVVEITTR